MPLAVAQEFDHGRSITSFSSTAPSSRRRGVRVELTLPDYLLKPSHRESKSQWETALCEIQLKIEWSLRSGDKLNKFNILGRLNSLNSLAEGWNGYGAAPINPAVIKAAERFISALPSDIVTSPRVVPMTRGRVQFEWHRGDRSLELEFESPELVHYLKSDSVVGIDEEDIIPIGQQNRILDLLKWFAAQ